MSRAKKPGRAEAPSPAARGAASSDALAVRAVPGGTLLPVRVTPRAGRAGLDGLAEGALRVRLTAPPVEGAANAALIDLLADRLGLPKSAITLASGGAARRKSLLVAGLAPEEVSRRLGLA